MVVLNWSKILLLSEQVVEELCLKFKSISKNFKYKGEHSPIEFVEGRVKKITSIINKANKKGIPFEEIENKIEDIAGVRIVCKFVEDIDKVINLIRERDGLDLKIVKERDYIKNRKFSGYRSYHIIIKYNLVTLEGIKEANAEIQIRTITMNFWASIEHSLRYKYKSKIPEDLQKRLIRSAEVAFNLDREMSQIRDDILEAQKFVEEKNLLVNNILKNIEQLHRIENCNFAEDINKEFLELYDNDDIIYFYNFNEQLEGLVKHYNSQ